jgi:hypothetical protein
MRKSKSLGASGGLRQSIRRLRQLNNRVEELSVAVQLKVANR